MRDHILAVILAMAPATIGALLWWQERLSRRENALDKREHALLANLAMRAAETRAIQSGPSHAVLDIIMLPLYAAADLYVAGGCGEPDGTLTIIRGRN